MTTTLTLGLLPPLKSGVGTLAQAGQHRRFVEQYLGAYVEAFTETLYFSYMNEELGQYTQEPALRSRARILPGALTNLYTFCMPFRWASEIRRCHVLRVFQTTGVIPAAISRLVWQVPFAVTYGYEYAKVARSEGHWARAMMLWLLEQIAFLSANCVIVTTPALEAHVKRRVGAKRVTLIPNSVDTDRFAPGGCLPGTRTVAYVGRLEPQKNLLMLIHALARIHPAPRLVVVGDGSQRDALLSQASALGISIEMRGVMPHDEIPDTLHAADAFVLPSLIEGHPKALLEAMSCGLPCVGLDVPGTRDVISHERTGLLCKPTVEALAAGVRRVLDDAELASHLGGCARACIEANYSARRLMEREIELLRELAGAAR